MRIAIATIHETVRGGVETYVAALVPHLRARGHVVEVVTEERGTSVPARTCSERVLELRPDVVLQNSLSSPVEEERLLRTGYPIVFFAHVFSGMCISGTRRHGRPEPEVCNKTFGLECWGFYFNRRCGGLNPLTAISLYRENQLRHSSLIRANAVVVASGFMADLVLQHGVPSERVTTIPFFVPQGPALTQDTVRSRFAARRALFLGRLTELKGWRQLLRAAELLKVGGAEWTLVFAGDGPDLQALEAEASRTTVSVELHPWLEPEARDELIGRATVLVIPSTWPEPFGLVGLEAARLGVPAVAFDVGGVREWLIPGKTGHLATPGSTEALASTIAQITRDERQYAILAEEARLQSLRFGADRHLSALEAVFARVARKPPEV